MIGIKRFTGIDIRRERKKLFMLVTHLVFILFYFIKKTQKNLFHFILNRRENI